MRGKLRNLILKQFSEHPAAYIISLFSFLVGCVSGIYYYKYIGSNQVPYYKNCLDSYILYIANGNADRWGIFWQSFSKNVQTLLLMMLCGLHPALLALSPILLIGRGFVLGFTVTVLVSVMGWHGTPVLLFGIIPQYIIFIPMLLYCWVLCYSRINTRIKSVHRAKRFSIDSSDKQYFMRYFIMILISAFIAGYIALIMPIIMNGVYGFLKSYI